jgi:iron complex outermembrane recepter protein
MNSKKIWNARLPNKIAGAVAALLLSAAVHAQVREFDIPSGELKTALDAYVAQTGQQLVYRSDDLKGLSSKGVQGTITQEQALQRLLEGTNLKIRRDASGAMVLFTDEAPAGDAPAVAAGELGTGVPKLQTVVVTGSISHLAESNRTGTRTDVDPMELPQSVSTVGKELLEQQQVRSLADAVSNVAGASGNGQEDGLITMRGFPAGIMRNGNIVPSGTAFNAPLITISKIEVVKGPEAIIAGVTSSYGGVVNVITKVPPAETVREVTASLGSRGYYEFGADLGGALNDDKSLLGRLVISKSGEGKNQVGYDGSSSEYVAPSLSWNNRTSGTSLTLSYEYQRSHTKPLLSIYFPQDRPLDSSLEPSFVPPANTGTNNTQQVISLALTQRIAKGWELGLKLARDHQDSTTVGGFSAPSPELGFSYPDIFTFGYDLAADNTTNTAKLELKGGFETGPVGHTLLVAYDNLRSTFKSRFDRTYLSSTNIETGVTTDLTSDLGPLFDVPSVSTNTTTPKESGLLVYDHMVWDKWVALLGWRQIRYVQGDPLNPDQSPFNKGLPSLGVVYRWTPTLSLYGSASKGFRPNFGVTTFDGKTLEPENSQQAELGFKALLADRKIALTGAIYQIKQKNVAVIDPDNSPANTLFWQNVPGVTSRGFELELSGNLSSRLNLRSSYAYLDKQATSADATGIAFTRHQASIWATYRFADATAPGWWLGSGLQWRSAAILLASTSATSPAESRIDLNGGYQAKQWSIVVGVKNLTNRRLYTITSSAGRNGTLVQPREFYTTARYSF